MKKILAAMLLSVVGVGISQATIVNFDDLSGQAAVADGYGGITWSVGGWEHYDWDQNPYNAHSLHQRVYSYSNGVFEFSSDVVFNGAWFAGQDSTSVSFDLYDDGNLVASSGSMNTSATPTWLGSGYGGMVDKVKVVSNAYGFFVMDDVTYNAVPEPASIAALAGGALVVLRRRRK
ncbi:MAG: PEP-CTERM sorting domain-containing protein [Armatimonadetes bacterium]|nr:PEP-CTERM sorting domain-containing protein [Armatimonadota bacterium]